MEVVGVNYVEILGNNAEGIKGVGIYEVPRRTLSPPVREEFNNDFLLK